MDLATATRLRPSVPELAVTRAVLTEGVPLPPGYHHLRHRGLVGHGPAAFAMATRMMRRWQMHCGAGLRVVATGPAVAGETVISRLGPAALGVLAPCRVVWSIDEPARAGFGYATLEGHPVFGEEGFLLTLENRGRDRDRAGDEDRDRELGADRDGGGGGVGEGDRDPGVVAGGAQGSQSACEVWLTVVSFSRAARWYVRLAGPVGRLAQGAFARRCVRALARGVS